MAQNGKMWELEMRLNADWFRLSDIMKEKHPAVLFAIKLLDFVGCHTSLKHNASFDIINVSLLFFDLILVVTFCLVTVSLQ